MYSAIYTGWFEKFDYREKKADMLTGRTVYMKQNTYPIHFHQPKTNIWAIGGGKGGVGKSLIAVSFGILLSRLGNRVLLVDADLGAPNLHTFMGMENGKRTLSGFLKGKIQNIDDTVTNTPIPNLGLISGSRDPLGVADLDSNSIARLKAALKSVEYDYVLLDIGPGTSFNMLELFLLADEGILVTTTEPTSIENTYWFLKCLFQRKMKKISDEQDDGGRLKGLLRDIFSKQDSYRIRNFADIFTVLRQLDMEQEQKLKAMMRNTGISIIINQTRKIEDLDVGISIQKACRNYFDMEIGYLDHICYEDCVGNSIRSKKPFIIQHDDSIAAKAMETCLFKLLRTAKQTGRL